MAGQEQHFTSWPENRTRQELEARSIQLILAQCRDPKGAGVAQRKQQTKFITSESGTLRHPLLEYPAHDPVFGLLLPFSTLNLTQNGPKQGCTNKDACSSLHSLWIATCDCTRPEQLPTSSISAGNVGIPRTRTRPLHRASFHREDGCNLDAKRFLQQR